MGRGSLYEDLGRPTFIPPDKKELIQDIFLDIFFDRLLAGDVRSFEEYIQQYYCLQAPYEHVQELIVERLGITMIYLTPVFPAQSNHRYDALSFAEVDPLLGGDEALAELVRVAHERGFTVIGDLTSNHSGDAHEWFRASHRNPGTPESEFYYWKDAEQEDYVSWLGVPSLPKFNWNSGELRRRFIQGPDSVVDK